MPSKFVPGQIWVCPSCLKFYSDSFSFRCIEGEDIEDNGTGVLYHRPCLAQKMRSLSDRSQARLICFNRGERR